MTSVSKWVRVSPKTPCKVCGKGDWCTFTEDGKLACCMRNKSERQAKNGGWLHSLTDIVPALPAIKPEGKQRGPGITLERLSQERGISLELLKKAGWQTIQFNNASAISIPYKDEKGELLRERYRLNLNKEDGDRFLWGKGKGIYPYGLHNLEFIRNQGYVILCESEMDTEALLSQGFPALGIPGALSWKTQWKKYLKDIPTIYAWQETDQGGDSFVSKITLDICNLLVFQGPKEAKDAARLLKLDRNNFKKRMAELLKSSKYSEKHRGVNMQPEEKIDFSQFQPITSQQLAQILGLTIKRDQINKIVTFLCALSAYTESDQLNVSFNAPSSTGKSFIPLEIAKLFPSEDVKEIGHCSPTAFFHDYGSYDKEKKGITVDLSRKILIFLDQPHDLLLQRLRPLLSHDKKEIEHKITDKNQKFGLRTKTVFLKGFPAVIFCTAGLRINEQEITRFLLLSPETNQEKLREAIYEKIKKESDSATYTHSIEEIPERRRLQERIKAIRSQHFKDIKIAAPGKIEDLFFNANEILKPRHQRDIAHIISLIKVFSLLNFPFRERHESIITANHNDINEAFNLWSQISESQDLNLPPYIYNLFKEVILPAYQDKNSNMNPDKQDMTGYLGLTRLEVTKMYFKVYGRPLPVWQLRQEIIPMLENAGLIAQEADPNDRRNKLLYPTTPLTISPKEKYSEWHGGVMRGNNEPVPVVTDVRGAVTREIAEDPWNGEAINGKSG